MTSRTLVCATVIAVLMMAMTLVTEGAVISVNPIIQGSLPQSADSSAPGLDWQPNIDYGTLGGGWWPDWRQGWLQYTLPEATSSRRKIESVTINFTNINLYHNTPDLRIAYVNEDNWDASDIYYDRFAGTGTIAMPYSINSSADITAYFDGSVGTTRFGDTLSIKAFEDQSGGREAGRLSDLVTLDITYVPEPASMALLGLGILMVLRRRR